MHTHVEMNVKQSDDMQHGYQIFHGGSISKITMAVCRHDLAKASCGFSVPGARK